MFYIIKKSANNFWHRFNNDTKEVNASDYDIILEDVGQTVSIQMPNGSNIPQKEVSILEVVVIDETDASAEETFANVGLLRARLIALGYTPYIIGSGGVQTIVAGTNITVDNTDPQNPTINATGGGGSERTLVMVTDSATDYTIETADKNKYKVFSHPSFTTIILDDGDFSVGDTLIYKQTANATAFNLNVASGSPLFFQYNGIAHGDGENPNLSLPPYSQIILTCIEENAFDLVVVAGITKREAVINYFIEDGVITENVVYSNLVQNPDVSFFGVSTLVFNNFGVTTENKLFVTPSQLSVSQIVGGTYQRTDYNTVVNSVDGEVLFTRITDEVLDDISASLNITFKFEIYD